MSHSTFDSPIPQDTNSLKPPKNARHTTPRVCATCRFAEWETFISDYGNEEDSGVLACTRPNGPKFEGGDMFQWFSTCDRWQIEDGEQS